jgi:predicted transcriptional regulator
MSSLTERLKTMGIKKYELARLMGVSPATVSRWGEHPPKYVWTWIHECDKVKQADQRVQYVIHRMDELLVELK